MIREIRFTKMAAAGNDFVVIMGAPHIKLPLKKLALEMCDRKLGVGADGLLIVERSRKSADVRMRIFNADGSEAEMCGNGARCVALWALVKPLTWKLHNKVSDNSLRIETMAGMIDAHVNGDNVRIQLTTPRDMKLDIPLTVNSRTLRVNFINTGVPHAVVFVEGLEKIDVAGIGKEIRNHRRFKPAGTNVDFVEIADKKLINVRTYERGVENETLACGTGSVASALLTGVKLGLHVLNPVQVKTKSGEIVKVHAIIDNNAFREVWLEGKVKIIYKGEYYV